MENLGSVQQKVSCVFETVVLDEQSSKRENQSYRVVASDQIKQRAIDCDVHTAIATEKLDGTCVYIAEFQGKPWLWARFDRKPNKPAERRFKKFQQQKQKGGGDGSDTKFKWDLVKDFKETPCDWIPASGVTVVDGSPVPDDIGHTPGWVPISPTQRQYCWHCASVDLQHGIALVLREEEDSDHLYIECVPLSQLDGHTAELIGTNINANPYGLGSKKCPIHLLVIHGSIKVKDIPDINSEVIKDWFKGQGQVEGVVWHCANHTLFKVHRNHVSLPWPVSDPALSCRPVEIRVDASQYELTTDTGLVSTLDKCKGHRCESLRDLETLVVKETSVANDTIVAMVMKGNKGDNTETTNEKDLTQTVTKIHEQSEIIANHS